MKLENISRRTYQHSTMNEKREVKILELKPKQVKDIPDEIAKIWLLSGEVREYIAPAEAKEKEAKAEAEKKALEAENEALKKELEALKAEKEKAPVEAKEKEAKKQDKKD